MNLGAQSGEAVGNVTNATRSPAKCGQRIAVVGTTGSGKTTMARRIAQRLAIKHVELDALHWGPNWTPAPTERFREHTAQALNGDTWVVDGNYSKVRDIVWSRADTIVWLDYPLLVILGRLVSRTLRRVITREELWQGNHEHFAAQFASRDSLFLWALRTYPRRRREYPALLQRPEHAHLAVVHLRSPRDARDWLAGLEVTAR
jgi:adenylate kinase family enzyme